MIYQFLPVDRVHYGIHVVAEQLINEIQRLGGSRVLLITTNSLLDTKAYKMMVELLDAHHIEVFVKCSKQHVPSGNLIKDLKTIRQFNPNLIISCGGGSAIDAGKILSFILANEIELEEELYLYSENIRQKQGQTMKDYLPHIAIPTTLSASEFTSIAGVTNDKDHIKYKFSNSNMTPKLVFLDPVFTEETPDLLWISTGIRAVDHAVETLYSPHPNPINTSLSLQALNKLYHYLPLSKKDPAQLEYRLECQVGAWLSLFSAVNIKLGLSHSIGHQLGALYNIPHGMTSAIMLPHVMKFLLPRTYQAQAKIPEALSKVEKQQSDPIKARMAPSLIKGLIQELDIPHRLRDFNVAKESIPIVVKNILMDIQGEENSFVLSTGELKGEITKLLEAAW